jgi:hypothetical protein
MKKAFYSALACCAWLASLRQAEASGGRVIGASMTNSQVSVLFDSTGGYSYQVQSNGTLDNRFWSDALPLVSATGNLTSVSVVASGPVGFFKVLEFTNQTFWYDWGYYYEAPFLSTWGMGAVQNSYAHADRRYDWYIDQADTGASADNNCGPSSVTMGIKWYNPTFSKTAEDARNTYPEGGGLWYTFDIINYLNLYSVPNTTSYFSGTNQLMGILGQGNLVILCISTAYLTQNYASEQRVGRFYSLASGHFLVVKGYRVVDGQVFFEVYDPNNWRAVYADATPKGRNRHLLAGELADAIANWWNFLIVIPPRAGAGGAAKANMWLKPVDPKQIGHMWGM